MQKRGRCPTGMVNPVRRFRRGFKPLSNYNKISSPPLRMGHLSNGVKDKEIGITGGEGK
jgi:hypothetical protein